MEFHSLYETLESKSMLLIKRLKRHSESFLRNITLIKVEMKNYLNVYQKLIPYFRIRVREKDMTVQVRFPRVKRCSMEKL